MRGVYKIQDTITTVTTAKVLGYFEVPADMVVEILSAKVTCLDESTNEQLYVKLARATGTVGGGDALTPKPTEEGSIASTITAKGGNTAITGMTADVDDDAIFIAGEQKQAGWEYIPLPEEREIIVPSDKVIIETLGTITSSTLRFEIRVREIG